MRFAVDINAKRVCIDDVDKTGCFYCQECGEQLVQRRGEIKAHHFAHFPNTKCTDNWQYDESEWHYMMQKQFPNDSQEIVLELDGKKHHADILIQARKTIVEVQGSRIRQTEFIERNNFFNRLGYKVIWIFEESIPFANNAIDNWRTNKSCMRKWTRPSKTFENFHPEDHKDIEIWLSKKRECDENEPIFFQVLSDDTNKGFSIMECGHCYTKKELFNYLYKGVKTIDRSVLYDIRLSIRRTDNQLYFYGCPLTKEPFIPIDKCRDCSFCELFDDSDIPNLVQCSGRCKEIDLNNISCIQRVRRNMDGFVNDIIGVDTNGEIKSIHCDVPPTSLRTMSQLWEKYRPVKYIFYYNVSKKRLYKVFNPGWQRAKTGIVKGYLYYHGESQKHEVEIYDADEPIWIVTGLIKKDD